MKGIDDGYFQREIQDSAYEYQKRVDADEETVAGVNSHQIDDETSVDLLKVEEESEQVQLERLKCVKDERDDTAVNEALNALSKTIDAGENVTPDIIDAVKVYATMREIMEVFEEHHGAYQETIVTA